jgi:hypothetical protein
MCCPLMLSVPCSEHQVHPRRVSLSVAWPDCAKMNVRPAAAVRGHWHGEVSECDGLTDTKSRDGWPPRGNHERRGEWQEGSLWGLVQMRHSASER